MLVRFVRAQVSNSTRTELWVKLMWFIFSVGDLEMMGKLLKMHEECLLNWSGVCLKIVECHLKCYIIWE